MTDNGASPLYTGQLQRCFTAGARQAQLMKGLGVTTMVPFKGTERMKRAFQKGMLSELIYGESSTKKAGFYFKR